MKMLRFLSAMVMVAGLFAMSGCSWDMNNPSADEWDVQIVGDSVFDLSGDIRTVLKQLSGKGYKDRSVSGAKIAAIDSQLATALTRTSLKTVIADGGANDILQGTMDCDADPLTAGCISIIDYVGDKMENMLDDMYIKGLDDSCVWLGYYHVKGEELEKNEAIDYCYSNAYPAIFGSSPVPAYLVDPRPYIFPVHIKSDDIHPTYDGSVILANMIWNVLVSENIYR
ncbi:MAG: SGNH/GDSL hydrolase family protein [Desulfobacteraceae bacterium]|nr:MAG: SGNH/GDSL hydrolase family protein [Desulfobacteraceae bacterium]